MITRQVITAAVGMPDWFDSIVLPRMTEAAKRWNAGLHVIVNGDRDPRVKMKLGELVPNAERTLWIDADCIVSRDSPNPFQVFPAGAFYAADDHPTSDPLAQSRMGEIATAQAIYGSIGWVKGYFNTGVVLCDDGHAAAWLHWSDNAMCYPEQTYVNYRARYCHYRLAKLPWQWNATPMNVGEGTAYIAHCAGIKAQALDAKIRELDEMIP